MPDGIDWKSSEIKQTDRQTDRQTWKHNINKQTNKNYSQKGQYCMFSQNYFHFISLCYIRYDSLRCDALRFVIISCMRFFWVNREPREHSTLQHPTTTLRCWCRQWQQNMYSFVCLQQNSRNKIVNGTATTPTTHSLTTAGWLAEHYNPMPHSK